MENPYAPPGSETFAEVRDDRAFVLASRWVRLGASLLDSLFVAVPAIAIAYLAGVYANISPQGTLPLQAQILGFFIGLATFMAINAWGIYARGQTVGKMIVGVRVVTRDGRQLNGNTYVFLRLLPVWIITQIPIVGGIFSIVDALLIFRDERNCLHDDFAGSRVINA